jgi:transcriptional regulator with PAS, ATPase and Fis domain
VQKVGSSRVIYVNVRVLSATNADLAAEIGAGRFREDLLYRLNTVVIHLPPLRERREDIWPLAEHYLTRYRERYRRALEGFDRSARQALDTHLWPGNVRELGHAIERAVLLKGEGQLDHLGDLGLKAVEPHLTSIDLEDNPDSLDLRNALTSVEKSLISRALDKTNGNRTEAAALLGLNRTTLVEKIRKHAS